MHFHHRIFYEVVAIACPQSNNSEENLESALQKLGRGSTARAHTCNKKAQQCAENKDIANEIEIYEKSRCKQQQ